MRRTAVLAALMVLALVSAAAVLALPGDYEMSWGRTAGGGTSSSTGGGYELEGIIGQADAGSLSGGLYSLSGGVFETVSAPFQQRVFVLFAPLVEKDVGP